MKLDIYKIDGKKSSKKAELSDAIFAIEPNETVLYEDVRRHMANKRQGTAKTKERSEVTGSTKKMYRQKGTGNARRGDIKSPLLRKGGTVFGPKPRDYGFKMNKKTRQLARKSALSLKAANEGIIVVQDFSFDEPKTSQVADMLAAFEVAGKKALILTSETDMIVYKSARNIPGVQVLEGYKPNTYQIMNADVIVIQESAVAKLENSIEGKTEEAAA
ncbi:MAG: 50S ribosomal protein L4 [Gracilimonas sp.]|uniref:Large ribosomal subunit protein uL4 n=1 Tax=Gracilimonas sediminicola TaxID=2952158 RepID=A0A9X2RCP8_9BACT|nr:MULTISPECIES: 50S ribosomal protein L4 [Gracilimonas]MBO6587466.1 50S ribosomal protein L4 [Gracilimonas sp.]MBO6617070.1 50S ribosomal protein L4 [Gracilimonas sp.]MCP9290906.1 50S ribosomal protein L4 [Gracilimonas sediminicola]